MGAVVEGMRQRTGDQEIVDRQEFLQLLVVPLISSVMAALRSMTVAAGMIGIHAFLTGVARIDMPAHGVRTAAEDVLYGLNVVGEQAVAVFCQIVRAVFPEDVR
jgi:hypothetical protein